MRIGVFGGTFDPPHEGHLALARSARDHLNLDEVLFVPAAKNPLKRHGPVASGHDRLRMVALLVGEEPGMSVSDVELRRGGPSFGQETLEVLQATRPGEYWWIMGSDTAVDLQRWRGIERIAKMCRFAVAMRRPTTPEDIARAVGPQLAVAVDAVPLSPQPASATLAREDFALGREPAPWIPAPVLQYIREKGLYGAI